MNRYLFYIGVFGSLRVAIAENVYTAPLRRPTSVEQGDVDGQFVLGFNTTARDVLGTEAQQLAHMTTFPEVATDMTVRVFVPTQGAEGNKKAKYSHWPERGAAYHTPSATGQQIMRASRSRYLTRGRTPESRRSTASLQLHTTNLVAVCTLSCQCSSYHDCTRAWIPLILRIHAFCHVTKQTTVAQLLSDDPDTNLTLSTEPVDESVEASVVASRDQIMPLELVDFEHPELAGLACEELLARFIPDQTDAILEVCLQQ